ncbi:hypothetical protein U9M48_039044, partial [Paspalum notatum var. saurae]
CQDAVIVEQYRPICLLNVSFKIFTKIATSRLNKVAQKVIRPSQTAFLPDRFILEGATVLHETLHEMHITKLSGVIFKNERILTFVVPIGPTFYLCGSVAVKVNSKIGRYFQTKKGLRQGDPFSPILFNLVVDMLAIYIARVKEDGQLQGLIPDLIDDGLSILIVSRRSSGSKKFKDFALRLKINFHKSELYCFRKAYDRVDQYSQFLGCGSENGEEHFQKKLRSKTSIVWWEISVDKFCFEQSGYQGDNHRKKYRLTKWGLGILNLEAQNACLFIKWLYKLINEDGIWQ